MNRSITYLYAFAVVITLSLSCDFPDLSDPETKEIQPPSVSGVSISSNSIKVGEIVNLSVNASDPQGRPLNYIWYIDVINGENYVEGSFLGSRESKQISWQANNVWNHYTSKSYGKVKICVDVSNFEKSTHAYRILTVYP
ncbi:MAG TPA: hypothetical protein ENN17_07810 [bacterium]|nr:hypothetical protein [bacterium]